MGHHEGQLPGTSSTAVLSHAPDRQSLALLDGSEMSADWPSPKGRGWTVAGVFQQGRDG